MVRFQQITNAFILVFAPMIILITPVNRNYPWKDGKLTNVHGEYPNAVKEVAKELNVKSPSFYAKPWMTEIGWRLDWVISTFFFQKRTLSKSSAKSLHSTDLISNEKIKKAIYSK